MVRHSARKTKREVEMEQNQTLCSLRLLLFNLPAPRKNEAMQLQPRLKRRSLL